MKTFYLVRHAKSSWDNPKLRDIERPLNERGLNDAPFMAKLMRSKGVKPDLLVSSPAIRALTTAAYFKNELGVEGEDLWVRDEIYEAMTTTVVGIINTLPEDCETAMVFGHNPTFTNVANLFTEKYIDNIPTCGVVHIKSEAATWPEVSSENSEVVATFFPKEFF
ncbi:MAG: histidine phosphatase family protein [Saprospiraceae bacterium]|nr:histidine phosphatase family protein [Saprospiraceae bacterium]MCF8249259.1 histidine phosphatase family protein [Saprospiraceae bacterium]MCF8281173.1 histidine phosphatase family protein [Bacteroidales bacterium]MCF8311464.1 histidine phosphatase family protein [Saprospiraceae bacterium]MCF8439878.1 histidine phosphatase family protein [Saprospiraceae bacterium]